VFFVSANPPGKRKKQKKNPREKGGNFQRGDIPLWEKRSKVRRKKKKKGVSSKTSPVKKKGNRKGCREKGKKSRPDPFICAGTTLFHGGEKKGRKEKENVQLKKPSRKEKGALNKGKKGGGRDRFIVASRC